MVVSVKSEYAGYDPVKDEETDDDEEDDLLRSKLPIKNEDDDVNIKDDDDDTDDECCRGKLVYERHMREYISVWSKHLNQFLISSQYCRYIGENIMCINYCKKKNIISIHTPYISN